MEFDRFVGMLLGREKMRLFVQHKYHFGLKGYIGSELCPPKFLLTTATINDIIKIQKIKASPKASTVNQIVTSCNSGINQLSNGSERKKNKIDRSNQIDRCRKIIFFIAVYCRLSLFISCRRVGVVTVAQE